MPRVTPRRRTAAAPPLPLRELLARAAARCDDPPVRAWLLRLAAAPAPTAPVRAGAPDDSPDGRAVAVNVKDAAPGTYVYVGRPAPRRGFPASAWGNPYRVGRDGTLADVLAKYRAWLAGRPELMARLPELRGKRLGCWCKPKPCHADILAEAVNALPAEGDRAESGP